ELQHNPDKLIEYAKNTFECVHSMGKFDEADKDMAHIIKALKLQKYSVYVPEEEKEKNLLEFEKYSRNIVTRLHEKARNDKSIESFKCAADSYKLYLDFYEESPVYKDMEANYAEALFSSNQYLAAGKIYEKMAKENAIKVPRDTLYSSVLSYYSALKKKEQLNYYETAYARDGLRKSGKLFVKNFPNSNSVQDVLFNVAWVAYDEGEYEKAIGEFSEFIKKYPNAPSAKAAVHLVLDAYHFRENYDGMIKFGNEVLAKNNLGDLAMRTEVREIVKSAESKIVSSMTVAAANDWEKGSSDLAQFAEENKDSGIGEQALLTLLVSGKEKGDLAMVYSSASKLLAQYPDSEKMESTLNVMIETMSNAHQFRLLAKYLEIYGDKYPKNKNSAEFIAQAGYIREIFEEYDQSNTNFEKYLRSGATQNGNMESTVFAMAGNEMRLHHEDRAISILETYRNSLSASGQIRADALISDLYIQKNDPVKASTYRLKAQSAYTPAVGKKQEEVKTAVAGMMYNSHNKDFEKYMQISLASKIDNAVVAEKAKTLESLEKAYLSIIAYESGVWGLKACYRSYEINNEFADFLKNAPLPDLPSDQMDQYHKILDQKIEGYRDKANQFQEACAAQAKKWETCDPELAAYFVGSKNSGRISSFSSGNAQTDISENFIQNGKLKQVHEQLMQKPGDSDRMILLAKGYIDARDYRQAIVIASKAIDEMKDSKKSLKAVAHNLLGLSYLYNQNDSLAKDAFKKALKEDSKCESAKINLAALFRHYGHTDKADDLCDSLRNTNFTEDENSAIHPRAKEMYNDKNRLAHN
ncbi:MAG: tetratricopeptide repeat protein, partial [Proteobacteria bacterium]|nr:tetratricopeptide repeat protein [Pseudomonadota bacterium]